MSNEITKGVQECGYSSSSYMTACEDGIIWGWAHPSVEVFMKIYKIFQKHGLIDPNLCFDPEHFMETVAKPNYESGRI